MLKYLIILLCLAGCANESLEGYENYNIFEQIWG